MDRGLEELDAGLSELRELARGIHPAVLSERGLAPALESLAARAPVPVSCSVLPAQRLPPPVETAAYFLVAEALTNVARYAQASEADVAVTRENGRAVIEVRDDGVGGADPRSGSGLRGIADRVAALDGRPRSAWAGPAAVEAAGPVAVTAAGTTRRRPRGRPARRRRGCRSPGGRRNGSYLSPATRPPRGRRRCRGCARACGRRGDERDHDVARAVQVQVRADEDLLRARRDEAVDELLRRARGRPATGL